MRFFISLSLWIFNNSNMLWFIFVQDRWKKVVCWCDFLVSLCIDFIYCCICLHECWLCIYFRSNVFFASRQFLTITLSLEYFFSLSIALTAWHQHLLKYYRLVNVLERRHLTRIISAFLLFLLVACKDTLSFCYAHNQSHFTIDRSSRKVWVFE